MKKILFGVLIFVVFGFGSWWFFSKKNNILSPVSERKVLRQTQDKMKTFGFLPTWMVGKTRIYTNEMTYLVFLGIETDEKGDLIWDTQSKKINSKVFLDQKQKISENGGKNILGIKLFDDEKLEKLLSNEEYENNLVKQIKEVVKEDGFDGVNIDFEFQNNPVAILEEDFGRFLNKLNLAEVGEISVDVFANTVIKGSAKQIESLISKIDYLVVMAYDFHRPGVDFAGSVAPISSNAGERNISEVVEKIINYDLNKSKIIMAYPLYGYEWKTYTKDFGSQIRRGWYQMSSWNRTKELIKEKGLKVNWDELSMTPWLVFEENNRIHQIYFENEKSLKAKLDLVEQNQLGGYGFWALGYEGEDTSIWGL
jgi:spore germination protein YaaH